jgi:probable F420-dependent oxidoreductase
MTNLKIDGNLPPLSGDVVDTALTAEEYGFDGMWTGETDNDAFLPHLLAAEHTDDLALGTNIALSFTRSPMVLAYLAWDLQQYSDGRFHLGLGTQVKGHNERRFSVNFDWESPGPRFREVIESIKHIFEVFQGEADELDYEGEYYQFSLMTDFFNPGPIDDPDIPIYVAGVNEYNLRTAGRVGDGLALHPFNTPEYTEEVVLPIVEEGAETAERSLDDVDLVATPLIVTGETDEEIEENREMIRMQIAFYASTRTYHTILEHYGWEDIGMELHELSKQDAFGEMGELVTDEMLETFSIEAPLDDLVNEVRREYGGLVDRARVTNVEAGRGI